MATSYYAYAGCALAGLVLVIVIALIKCVLSKSQFTVENMAPVNIKSTNRHWRFYSPHIFGLAGPAGTLAGSADRTVLNVSQLQHEEDLAQSRWIRQRRSST